MQNYNDYYSSYIEFSLFNMDKITVTINFDSGFMIIFNEKVPILWRKVYFFSTFRHTIATF